MLVIVKVTILLSVEYFQINVKFNKISLYLNSILSIRIMNSSFFLLAIKKVTSSIDL